LKNPPTPASEPLFSPNSTSFEGSEPHLKPSMALQSTFSTGSKVFETLLKKRRTSSWRVGCL
jgi:hypothetical protein